MVQPFNELQPGISTLPVQVAQKRSFTWGCRAPIPGSKLTARLGGEKNVSRAHARQRMLRNFLNSKFAGGRVASTDIPLQDRRSTSASDRFCAVLVIQQCGHHRSSTELRNLHRPIWREHVKAVCWRPLSLSTPPGPYCALGSEIVVFVVSTYPRIFFIFVCINQPAPFILYTLNKATQHLLCTKLKLLTIVNKCLVGTADSK